MYVYSDDHGNLLVNLARETVEEITRRDKVLDVPSKVPDRLTEKSGVFVTLNLLKGDAVSLRGCIGRPYPTQPLIEATIDSAIDAATRDPRFRPVIPEELDSIIVELSVLTPPKKLQYSEPKDLLEIVKVGRDGLIASRGHWRGLLLPQVPVDWEWNVKEFLEHTCRKAGLPADAWLETSTEFQSFQAEIFGEKTPRGSIIRNPHHPRC